ncbi:MAG TPA: hypothetical protein VKQ36_14630, partial [Ktedonobacterales bacterium]|nr:hypothetical protein [Ktedonobacterales bacterium]
LDLEDQLDQLERRSRLTPPERPSGGPSDPSPYTAQPARRERRTGAYLALSGLIRQTLQSVATRTEERRRLVNILVLAQVVLTVIIAPGYIVPTVQIPMLATLAFALVIYGVAFVLNRRANNTARAIAVLVIGGALAVTAHVFVSAVFAHNPSETALASLLFLATIFESGLLLAPEVTLLTAASTAMATVVALLLAISLSPTMARASDAYLLVVYTVTLQGLAGYLAWLASQFIFQVSLEMQQSQASQFAEVRLGVLQDQLLDQRRRLDAGLAAIQTIITHALSEEYDIVGPLPDGELRPLAESLALLVERMKELSVAGRKLQRVEAMAAPLVEVAGRMADNMTPTPSMLPIMTETALDSVPLAMGQAQAANARRLGRVQRLAGEISAALGHSRNGLSSTAEEILKAQRIAGALRNMAEALTQATQKQLDLLGRARRSLTTILPAEITQTIAPEDIHRDATGLDPETAARLLGLNVDVGITPGFTAEFNALPPSDPAEFSDKGIAPMTAPLPTITSDDLTGQTGTNGVESVEGAGSLGQRLAGDDLPAELVDVWNLLTLLNTDGVQHERAVSSVTHDLGILSRSIRQADVGAVWVLQALDAIRRDAEQLQQISGSSQSALDYAEGEQPSGSTGVGGMGTVARPASTSVPLRPLADGLTPAPSSQPTASPSSQPSAMPPEGAPGSAYAPPSGPLQPLAAPVTPQDAPGSLRVSDLIGLDVMPP